MASQFQYLFHGVQDPKIGHRGKCIARRVAPRDQTNIGAGRARGSDINRGIAAKENFARGQAELRKRDQRAGRVGFARARRIASDNRHKVPCQTELGEDFLAQVLRLVRADCERNSGAGKCGKRLVHTGKWQGAWGIERPVPVAELGEIGGGVDCMLAHHGADHGFAADRIHHSDQIAVRAQGRAARCKHRVDDLSGKLGAVDQSSIQIEDNTLIVHKLPVPVGWLRPPDRSGC